MPDQTQTVPIPHGATIGQAQTPQPQGVPIPAGATLGRQAQPQPASQPGETPGASQITGISAQPKDDSIGGKLSAWAENVSNDIKNGTDVTGVGTVLKRMGAHGVYNGNSKDVGGFMASLPLGLARVAKGTGEVAPGSKGSAWQGTRDIVGGGLQAATMPLAVGSPVEAEAAASGAAKAASKIGEVADTAGKLIPNAKRAGETMEQLRTAIGNHPVEITDDLSKAASRVQELADNGNTMPSAARKFLNRVTDPEKGHLTYSEARDFMTKFGNMTAEEQTKLAPVMKAQMQQLGGALRNAVEATAARAGKLEEFQNSMREYAAAKKLQAVSDFIKQKGISIAGKAALGAGAYGLYRELKDILE
jgi:hypothetical protein